MELRCKQCNNKYFAELPVTTFKSVASSPTQGYQPLKAESNRLYMCINPKCQNIIAPEINSFSVPKEDLRVYQEIQKSLEGDPQDIQATQNRRPSPGEMLPRG